VASAGGRQSPGSDHCHQCGEAPAPIR
jgi:hypothetical protein